MGLPAMLADSHGGAYLRICATFGDFGLHHPGSVSLRVPLFCGLKGTKETTCVTFEPHPKKEPQAPRLYVSPTG